MKLFIYMFTCLLSLISIEATEESYPKLLNGWKENSKNKVKFVLTNQRKEKIDEGYLEWDLSKNIWIFYFKKETIKIENHQVIKTVNGVSRKYPCSGFAKILATSMEKWGEVLSFDNEIEIENDCYTEFRTNKSYMICHFKVKPFKLISITFGENKENYIMFFE